MSSRTDSEAPSDGHEGAPDGHQTLGRRARWLARLGALALGAGLIVLVELALTVADYDGPTELFLKAPEGGGAQSCVTNYDAYRSTFASNPVIRALDKFPAPPAQRFPARAPEGTFRICVMGGSAARGYPHRINGAFPHFLERILNAVCEGRRFEVVNVGVTAVNSHSVRERVAEALTYDADMLVVYSGHNEFYGAFGPGSSIPLSSRLWMTRVQMWLRRRRLSMLMGDLMARALSAPPEEQVAEHLVDIMPRRRDIRYGDDLYLRVRANYGANLASVARTARARRVPVVVCTLGANLRDFPPMGSLHGPGVAAEGPPQWNERVAAAAQSAAAERWQQAAAELQEAVRLSPGHAETHYKLARCLDKLGQDERAAEHYSAARDLDTVRWRAAGDFNEVVRDVARAARDEGVILADVEAYLARAEGGPPGERLFLEHVHPTLEGNFTIAEAVARAMAASGPGGRLGTWDWSRHGTFEDYARAAGLDVLDVIVARQTAALLHDTLMDEGGALAGQYAALLARVAELEAGLAGPERAAWEQALATGLFQRTDAYDLLRLLLVQQYGELGRLDDALAELEKAKRYGYWQVENPRYAALFVTEAALLLKKKDPAGAIRAAEKALALDPGRPGALERLAEAQEMLRRPAPPAH